jgi:hypothetical protein
VVIIVAAACSKKALEMLQSCQVAMEFLLFLAMLSKKTLTLGKSISLAMRNTLYLGFWVDIAS